MNDGSRSSRCRSVALSVLALIVSVAVAELILWVIAPLPDPHAIDKRQMGERVYVPSSFRPGDTVLLYPEPGLPGVSGPGRLSINNAGYRGGPLAIPKPDGEFRIFMLGGSTTESLYLDDRETITHHLEQLLAEHRPDARRVRVYNAGKSGDRSYDHVAMLAHRIVHLQPDLVIVFAGVNDMVAGLMREDYLLFEHGTAVDRSPVGRLLRYLSTESQIMRRVWAARHRQLHVDLRRRITIVSDYAKKAALASAQPVSDSLPRIDTLPYAENLATLAGIARAHGFEMIFMTQPSTWMSEDDPDVRRWHWITYLAETRYREELLEAALERYNETMRRSARTHGVTLLDLSHTVPKSLAYFYDDVHLNEAGTRRVAELLANVIRERHTSSGEAASPGQHGAR